MATVNRPISPHLQVYKPQLTSVLSITHRGTGIFLSLGALLLTCWLLAIANGPASFKAVQSHILSWYGQVLLFAWLFSLYFHLCNGIRHLVWDAGAGLGIRATYLSGYAALGVTILLTLGTWCLAGGGT